MREIKFRFWDRNIKKIVYLLNPLVLHLPDNSGQSDYMQFTGLKDKNGKDIYEGDRMYIKWNGFGDVTFRNGRFVVESNEGKITELSNHWGENCEIIGNKFENPELLK